MDRADVVCMHCEDNESLIHDFNNGPHMLDISKADNSNKYYLVMFTPFGQFSVEINHCPICGRKLGD